MRSDRNRLTKARESGFTLLELIIAISILTVGLLAVASMQMAAITGNAKAFALTEATTLAQDSLEELMAGADDNQTSGPTSCTTARGYTVTSVVTPISGVSAFLLTVTTQWTDRGVTKTTGVTGIKPELF